MFPVSTSYERLLTRYSLVKYTLGMVHETLTFVGKADREFFLRRLFLILRCIFYPTQDKLLRMERVRLLNLGVTKILNKRNLVKLTILKMFLIQLPVILSLVSLQPQGNLSGSTAIIEYRLMLEHLRLVGPQVDLDPSPQ